MTLQPDARERQASGKAVLEKTSRFELLILEKFFSVSSIYSRKNRMTSIGSFQLESIHVRRFERRQAAALQNEARARTPANLSARTPELPPEHQKLDESSGTKCQEPKRAERADSRASWGVRYLDLDDLSHP